MKETKTCKHCKEEINKSAKKCPKCGGKQGGVVKWIIIGVIAIAIIGGAASGGNTTTKKDEKTGTTQKVEKLELEDGHTGAPDEYNIGYYIEGYIKNNTDKDYSYVQVTFTAYDSDGNTLGTCVDNNSGLEANGRWKFKAMCLENVDKIASYKLKEVTGY